MDRLCLLLVIACLLQVGLSQSPSPSPSPSPFPTPAPTPNPWDDPAFRDCLLAYANFISPPSYQYFLMMDYTGKAVDDMGNYDGCLELPKNLSHYCVAQTSVPIGKVGEAVPVFLGICAPVQCNATLLSELLVAGLDKYNITGKFDVDFELEHATMYCQPRDQKIEFSTGAIITLIICGLLGVLVIGGTSLEYIEAQLAIKEMNRLNLTEERQGLLDEDEKRISISSVGSNGINIAPGDVDRLTRTESGKPNKFHQLLKCFAIESNLKFLMNDNRGGEPGLSALNGLRVLMMFWIILGHTFTYLTTPVGFDNSITVTQHVIERVSFQVVSAAELAVDVFFYISGFLVVYMLLKEMKTRRGGIPWGLFYFHRYWRLTPVYGLIILIYTTLSPLMIYGPFAHLYRGMKTDFCDKYWWTNLLYINNFIPTDSNDQCFGWGWYLADDMQYFIFTPFIVLLFKKSRKAAWALIASLIVVCLSLNAFLVHKYHLHPLDPGDANWNTIVYNKPYTRMAPYLIGIGCAFIVQYDIDLARNWMVRWAGYIIGGTATTCGTYLTYGFWRGSGWVLWQNVVYATFVRVGFVMGVAWFMYACYKQHGGVLRSILSVYMWVPLARLTYTAYLTHPIIMFVINFSATTNFHYSAIYGAVRYSSHLTLAYVCGLVFHLAIEKPTANLERLFLPQKKKSSH